MATPPIWTRQQHAEAAGTATLILPFAARYEALIEHSLDMTAILDERGVAIYTSPGLTTVLGYQPAEFLMLEPWCLVHPEDLPHAQAIWAKVMHEGLGASQPLSYRLRHANGTWRWLDATLTNQLAAPAVRGIVLNALDVTDAKTADARYQGVFAGAADAILIADAQGHYIDANPAASTLLGYSRDELLGLRVTDIVAKAPEWTTAEYAAFTVTGHWRGELELRRRDGSRIPVESRATRIDLPDGPVFLSILRDMSGRRAVEAALRRSEARYQAVFARTADAILIADAQQNYRDANPAATALLGYSREELLQMSIADVVAPEYALTEVEWAAFVEAGRLEREAEFRRRDGSRVPVEIRSARIDLPEGPLFFSLVRDLSAQRAAEAAVRASEARYRSVFEGAADALLIIDLAGNYLDANPAAVELLGYSRDEIRTVRKETLVARAPEWTAAEFAALTEAGYWRGEVELRRRDGSRVPVEAQGTQIDLPDGPIFLLVGRDMSEHKAAETALRASESRFATAFHSSPVAMSISHQGDGRLIDANERFVVLSGFERSDLIGRTPEELGIGPSAEDSERLEAILRETGIVRNVAIRVRAKGGHLRDARLSIAQVDLGGEPCILTLSEDMTERKHVEEALRLALSAADMETWDWDLLTGELRWSSAMEAQLGQGSDLATGTYEEFLATVHPEYQPVITRKVAAALEDGADYEAEYRSVGPDGTPRWDYAKGRVVRDPRGRAIRMTGVVLDQTARRQAEEAIRASEARFRALVQHASDLIAIVTPDGIVQYVSPASERVLGYPPANLVGSHYKEFLHPDDLHRAQAFVSDVLTDPERICQQELRARHRDDSWRWLQVTTTNLVSEPGVGGIVVNARDITERKMFEAELTRQALSDALTGLPNRVLLMDRLEHALDGRLRHPKHLAVLFLDLDRFKGVNDRFGHAAGDRLLVAASERLAACLRPGDTLARFGGDEFVALLEDLDDAAEGNLVAERLVTALKTPFRLDKEEVFLGVSIGIAVGRSGQSSADDLLREADIALYRAKTEKANIAHYTPSMGTESRWHQSLETDLRGAIERRELELHYQPIVEVTSGRLVALETLTRWRHPIYGHVSPEEFIPVAEESGLILPLGEWVLTEACHQLARWDAIVPDGVRPIIAINVSPRQFRQADLVGQLTRILSESGLAPDRLRLEITEQVFVSDLTETAETLQALRDLGISVAIDDFGSGYSSLGYLCHLPVDAIKIDQSFIQGLGADAGSMAIVEAMTVLAQTLGLRVTAEGIETAEQLSYVLTAGCNWGQGYYFAKPVPAAEIAALIAATEASDCHHMAMPA